ncbi:synaptojanin-2-binding protein-like isoform X2 [Pomacea canaliculata]|nr:synaptojanin-2-binding protein-like isoform X2 [Pomacea canaliculata]
MISGLGFNIRGGIDLPHAPNDTGIFVTRIKEDGAAFKDRRLKEGDKILEVNGKNIERVTHNEAVQIFITAGNVVRMKVQHGAYAYIMKNIEAGRGFQRGSSSKKYIACAVVFLAIAGIGVFVVLRQRQQAS